jgi:hypothetical protein
MRKFLFLLAFLPSCAHTTIVGDQKPFQKYIEIFEDEAAMEFPKGQVLYFVDSYGEERHPNAVGYCADDGSISFLRSHWENISETKREIIFLHDAAHGLFGFDHNDTMDESGTPTSLMSSVLKKELVDSYEKSRSVYLDRLFPWRNQWFTGWGNFPFTK